MVSGGAKGIGHAISMRLARAGHEVIAVGRDQKALTTLDREATDEGLTLRGRVCDITTESAVTALTSELGPVDILVNNAGTSASAPLHRTSLSDWQDQLRINATGAFLLTRALVPGMREAGWGRIVFVASTAALVGARYTVAYTASKHAELGLARAVAAEVSGTGVTSNAVCPTFVDTAMTQRSAARISEATGRSHEEATAALMGASSLGRLLEPNEVAAAVCSFLGEDTASINGQTLVLDGGDTQR